VARNNARPPRMSGAYTPPPYVSLHMPTTAISPTTIRDLILYGYEVAINCNA
jgi:hypothetical protein